MQVSAYEHMTSWFHMHFCYVLIIPSLLGRQEAWDAWSSTKQVAMRMQREDKNWLHNFATRGSAVHNSDYNKCGQNLVGLSWAVLLMTVEVSTQAMACSLALEVHQDNTNGIAAVFLWNARAFHLLQLHHHHHQPWQNSNDLFTYAVLILE